MDVSSHQPRDLSNLIALHGIQHVIVRLYLTGEIIPQDHTREQIASTKANGCSVGGYVWCYSSFDPVSTVREGIALARECEVVLPVLWMDCETFVANGVIKDRGPSDQWLRSAIAECRKLGVVPGIYTGAWWWTGYMGNTTEFGDVPLWVGAQYDGIMTLESVKLFGGWDQSMLWIKQYIAEPVDLNVLNKSAVGA